MDSLIRPTINLFLYEIEENTELRQTNMPVTRGQTQAVYRMPPRRFELRYLVSVLTTVVEDEHLLVWRALATLMRDQYLPPQVLATALRSTLRQEGYPEVAKTLDAPMADPGLRLDGLRSFVAALDLPPEVKLRCQVLVPEPQLVTKVSKPNEGGARLLDLWSALELPPRPALLYVLTAPLDLDITFESPVVLTRTLRTRRGPDVAPDVSIRIGGRVLDKNARPVVGVAVSRDGSAVESITDHDGRFVLDRVPTGSVKLRIAGPDTKPKRVTISVPSDSYDVALD